MEVSGGVLPFFEQQFLLAKEVNHNGLTPMKEEMMQVMEEILIKDFKLGFKFANTRKIWAFFRFLDATNEYDSQTSSGHHTDKCSIFHLPQMHL